MKLIDKDIWKDKEVLDYIGITTNSVINYKGHLVMGAGIAKEAKKRYPYSPEYFGEKITSKDCEGKFYGIIKYLDIFAFQTKLHWRDKAPLAVVEASVNMLNIIARNNTSKIFGLPFPAVNNGGRSQDEILPLLEKLPDNVWVYKLQEEHKIKIDKGIE